MPALSECALLLKEKMKILRLLKKIYIRRVAETLLKFASNM
jgi:hypothetical protein